MYARGPSYGPTQTGTRLLSSWPRSSGSRSSGKWTLGLFILRARRFSHSANVIYISIFPSIYLSIYLFICIQLPFIPFYPYFPICTLALLYLIFCAVFRPDFAALNTYTYFFIIDVVSWCKWCKNDVDRNNVIVEWCQSYSKDFFTNLSLPYLCSMQFRH